MHKTPFPAWLSRLTILGPAIAAIPLADSARSGLGALIGLALVAGAAALIPAGPGSAGLLIAPFGATAVLVFAAPNSPLAQPWSAIVGNTVSALVAIAVTSALPGHALGAPLSVGLAVLAMALCRATHPPGGAVALTVALIAAQSGPVGPWFALVPVALGTAILVCAASLHARLTGRRYPFRQFGEANANRTHDRAASERLGLSERELSEILVRYRQSQNVGVEDLARLIAAVELQAAANRSVVQSVAEIMSRDLVTVGPRAGLAEVLGIFARHGFTSLPVVEDGDRFLGVIFQLHLVRHLAAAGLDEAAATAGDIMLSRVPTVAPSAPVAALLPHLALHGTDAVPVLDGARIVGIVTQTDLVAALARQSVDRAVQAAG